MEIKEAVEILEFLANGVDPSSGEKIPQDSSYNNPDSIRALFTCINYIKHPPKRKRKTIEEKQAENLNKGLPRNSGMPWTEDLKKELTNTFKSGMLPKELAGRFERTTGAIISELKKMNLITKEEAEKFILSNRPHPRKYL